MSSLSCGWNEQSGIWWVSSRVYGGGPQDYNVISWDWIPIPIPNPSPSRLTKIAKSNVYILGAAHHFDPGNKIRSCDIQFGKY